MGGRLFEAGRLITFSAFSMGAYSRLALIRINTVNCGFKQTSGPPVFNRKQLQQ